MTASRATGYRHEVRGELRRLVRAPRSEISAIAFNALLVCLGWVLLPAGWRSWVFSGVHGPLAFVLVLQTWMLSDACSTNLLGHDAPSAIAALHADGGLSRLIRVKVTALAVLVGPPCAIVSVVLGVHAGNPVGGLLFALLLLAAPLGVTAITSMLGVLLPYRVRSVRWRVRNRRPWSATLRWAVLVVTPYWLIGPVLGALVIPVIVVVSAVTGSTNNGRLSNSTVELGVPVASLLFVLVFVTVPMLSDRIARARRGPLIRYLSSPDAG